LTDVPVSISEIRAGRLSILDYLSSLRGPIEFAVLAPDDPVPALIEVPAALYLAWRRHTSGSANVMRAPEHLVATVPNGNGPSR